MRKSVVGLFVFICLSLLFSSVSVFADNYAPNISSSNAEVVTISESTSIKGIATDGTYVYVNDAGSRIKKLYFNGTVISSHTISGLGAENGDIAYSTSAGKLYIRNSANSGNIYFINLTSNTTSLVTVDTAILSGNSWGSYNIFDMPDGRIGTVSNPSTNPFTIRLYNISENGTFFTRDEDINISASWSTDNHGWASDGTYLVLLSYSNGHKVFDLNEGNEYYDGTSWDIRPTGIGNPTFITWDHTNNRILVGDYSDKEFIIFDDAQLSADPSVSFVSPTLDNATQSYNGFVEINFSITQGTLPLGSIAYNWNGTNFTFFNDSLVLMYNLDNRSSLGENDSVIFDISGSGNNGTWIGGTGSNSGPSSSGRHSVAYEFDGDGDYVDIGDAVVDSATQLSFAMWVKVDDLTKDNTFVSKGEFNVNVPVLFWRDDATSSPCAVATDALSFLVSTGSTDARVCSSSDSFNDNGWHFIVGTFKGSSSTGLNIYLDGVKAATSVSTSSVSSLENSGDSLRFGAPLSPSTSKDMDGLIDDVMVFNRELSADEVYELYVSSLTRLNSTSWSLYLNQSQNATTGLSFGNYTYQAFVEDNESNLGSTLIRTVEIVPDSTPPTFLTIPENLTITYGNYFFGVFFTAVDETSFDGFAIDDSRFTINASGFLNSSSLFGVNNYTINVTINDSSNNLRSALYGFVVNQSSPVINLTINSSSANISIPQSTSVLLNGSLVTGDSGARLLLYKNGSLINNATAEASNQTTFSIVGLHNMTLVYAPTQNYSRSFATYYINVTSADTTPPKVSILSPQNTTYYLSSITFNVSLGEAGSAWYSLDSGVTNFSLTPNASSTGFSASNSSIVSGSYVFSVYANDSAGNNNFTESVAFSVYALDADNDGVLDLNDTLQGNESSVNNNGVSVLNITVSGGPSNGSFSGVKEFAIRDGSVLLLNFSHNFSAQSINLSRVLIIKDTNLLIINFSGQLSTNKTLYLQDNSFQKLCVKDQPISASSGLTSDCSGSGEIDFISCENNNTGYTIGNITCYDTGSFFRFENLQHSGLRGILSSSSAPPSGGGGGGGGSHRISSGAVVNDSVSDPVCEPSWDCSSWSFCSSNFTQRRTCDDSNSCLASRTEVRACPDILFDSLVELQTKRLLPWSSLKFDVDLMEVNTSELVDIKVIYRVMRNAVSVYEESETRAVKEKLSYTKEISDLNLPPGEYSLSVVLEYGKEQTASAEKHFIVIGSATIIIALLVVILLLILTFVLYSWHKSKKKTEILEDKLESVEDRLSSNKATDDAYKREIIKRIEQARVKSAIKSKGDEFFDSDNLINDSIRK